MPLSTELPIRPSRAHTVRQQRHWNALTNCILPFYARYNSTDARYLTLWLRSAAMTTDVGCTSVSVVTGNHPHVDTAKATAYCTTKNATVEVVVRVTGISVANSIVPTIATHGSPWQFRRNVMRNHPWQFHGLERPLPPHRVNHHGSLRRSVGITTAGSADV